MTKDGVRGSRGLRERSARRREEDPREKDLEKRDGMI